MNFKIIYYLKIINHSMPQKIISKKLYFNDIIDLIDTIINERKLSKKFKYILLIKK